MLDRYVQDSADNAHPSSHNTSSSEGEDDDNDGDGDGESSTASETSAESNDEQQYAQQPQPGTDSDQSAHLAMLARLAIDDAKAGQHSEAVSACGAAQPSDAQHDVGSAGPDGKCMGEAEANSRHLDTSRDEDLVPADQLPEDLPDHVAIRRGRGGATAGSSSEAAHDFDDAGSVMSHSVQVPSQEAVQRRVVEQQRSRMRQQVLARASRNAQKVGNKRERKQTASSVNW